MLLLDVEIALNTALKSLLEPRFGTQIAWPGVWRDRVEGVPWCRIVHSRGRPQRVTAGTNGLSEHPGLTQVDMWFPAGTGTNAVTTAAEVLHVALKPGTTLQQGVAQVQVYSRGLGTLDDRQQPWIWAPFTIRWTVFATDDV